MAFEEKRGWVWNLEEKNMINGWKGDLQIKHNHISVQLERFKYLLPNYYDEAVKAAKTFIETADILLSLDGRLKGKKYSPISPKESEYKLNDVERGLAVWMEFVRNPDVQSKIKEANRRLKKIEEFDKTGINEYVQCSRSCC